MVAISAPMKDDLSAAVSASPARPCLASGWPSKVVATDHGSPGMLKRIALMAPPNSAPIDRRQHDDGGGVGHRERERQQDGDAVGAADAGQEAEQHAEQNADHHVAHIHGRQQDLEAVHQRKESVQRGLPLSGVTHPLTGLDCFCSHPIFGVPRGFSSRARPRGAPSAAAPETRFRTRRTARPERPAPPAQFCRSDISRARS